MKFYDMRQMLRNHHPDTIHQDLDDAVIAFLRSNPVPERSLYQWEFDPEFIKNLTKRSLSIIEDQPELNELAWSAARYCKFGCQSLTDDGPERNYGIAHLISRSAQLLACLPDNHASAHQRLMNMFRQSTTALRKRWQSATAYPRHLNEFMSAEYHQRGRTAERIFSIARSPAWAWRAAEDLQTSTNFEELPFVTRLTDACLLYCLAGDDLERQGMNPLPAYQLGARMSRESLARKDNQRVRSMLSYAEQKMSIVRA